ncbi:hypothetical protein THAOC_06090, partial [Thalassiosira oceanica]
RGLRAAERDDDHEARARTGGDEDEERAGRASEEDLIGTSKLQDFDPMLLQLQLRGPTCLSVALLKQLNRPHVSLGYERVLDRVHPLIVLERGGVPAARQQGLDQRRAAVDVSTPACPGVRGDEEADRFLARPASQGDVKRGSPEDILLGERARCGLHHLLQQLERRVVVNAAVDEGHAVKLVDFRYSMRRGAKRSYRAQDELLECIPVPILDIVEDQFDVPFDTLRVSSLLVGVWRYLAPAAMPAGHRPSIADRA